MGWLQALRRRGESPAPNGSGSTAAPPKAAKAPKPPAAPILDADKHLLSDLWLDQPDADEQIDARLGRGEITDEEATKLHGFVKDGYLSLSLADSEHLTDSFDADIERIWDAHPYDLAGTPKSGDRTSFRDLDEKDRTTGYRIIDMHSHAPTARDLYLNPDIFRLVELIFDQKAVAFQSIYFEYGSEQSLHRDPMFVVTDPPSHLSAAWIALEDIEPDSGPLLYVPGSHHLPWFEFEPDTIRMVDKSERVGWSLFRAELIERYDLKPVPFTCKRGDVFIWHGGLLHGGAAVTNPDSSRKSFVVHFSTAADYHGRRASMQIRDHRRGDNEWRGVSEYTTELLEQGDRIGIDNPLHNTVDKYA